VPTKALHLIIAKHYIQRAALRAPLAFEARLASDEAKVIHFPINSILLVWEKKLSIVTLAESL